MIKLFPFAILFPFASYQFIIPSDEVASSVTVPVSQRDAAFVEVIVGVLLTVAVIAVLVKLVQEEEVFAST